MDLPTYTAASIAIIVCPEGHAHFQMNVPNNVSPFVTDAPLNLIDALALQNALTDLLNDPNIEWNTDHD
jgi:hypothetical protein